MSNVFDKCWEPAVSVTMSVSLSVTASLSVTVSLSVTLSVTAFHQQSVYLKGATGYMNIFTWIVGRGNVDWLLSN